jgi:ABC-type multidrug transport system ATPase subunit
MFIIETQNLNFRFSSQEIALKDIQLQVPEGSIYGFLGPNGAGKTTTLRLILGLLQKQEGKVLFFEKDFDQNRIEILKNVGTLIEAPSLYAHLTATENLQILQKIYQCPKERIAEVLEIVGLSKTGKKKAGKFSLGMKQRLSIAMALLHEPKILILDEPTNGLDPNGIIEIRELLKKLNSEKNITVLISSHLLSEIEKLVSHVGIIHKGEMLFQGTLDDLHKKQSEKSLVGFETNNISETIRLLNSNGYSANELHGMVQIPLTDKKNIAMLNQILVQNGIEVYHIGIIKNDLESIFIDLVK